MRFSEILPSKWLQRIIIVILACVVVGFAIHTYLQKKQEKKLQEEVGIDVSYVDLEKESADQADNDGDGVPNWEEALWGLDPEKFDTDNDGVSDGLYVKSKKETYRRSEFGEDSGERTLTKSEELGRGLYTALLAIEQVDGTFDSETEDQISDNIVEYIESIPIGGKIYFREDLSLVGNTKDNTYQYRDEIESALIAHPINPSDVELIALAIENTDPYKTKISRLAIQYSSLVEILTTMNVPFAIAGRHTEFLNGVSHISETFKGLDQEGTDEIILLSAVVQMQDVLASVSESVGYIQVFFDIIEDETVFN